MKNLFLFLILNSCFVFGQNLVPNAGFETYSVCPTSGQFPENALGWQKSLNNNISPHHTDYFNGCATGYYDVPSNTFGNQAAFDGNAYMGMTMKAPSIGANFRENIYIMLSSPLVAGALYSVSVQVSLADNFKYAANKVGIKFSKVPNFPINNFAHVFAAGQLTNSVSWTPVSGVFEADSNYTYMAIGNFFDDANTTETTVCASCSQAFNLYYIDGASVTLLTPSQIKETSNMENVTLFPNPASGKVVLKGLNSENYKIKVVNALGQVVLLTDNSLLHNSEIDISAYSKGLYFVEIECNNFAKTKKLVVE